MTLDPGILVDAAAMRLTHEPLPDDQVISGLPTAGLAVLVDEPGREIGVWEMTPGTATDVEVDELFVVIAGRGTLRFEEVPDGPVPDPIELRPGSIVRLTEGMRTTWTVTETLRKVYVA